MFVWNTKIMYSQLGRNCALSLPALLDLFQDIATLHAHEMGSGLEYLYSIDRAWIMSRWRVRLEKLPRCGDHVTVRTRAYECRRALNRRAFELVDQEGAVLSVGEAQKVSLARAFTNDSPVVILDEPSSALDPIAEYNMFKNMLEACEDRTLIFISHRLSSAVLADRIFMMEDGCIKESGTHKELMKKNGKYAQMFRMQAENYAETESEVTGRG